MELYTQLKALSEKIGGLKHQIKTEEATKTAFVLPFIQILGYDIFDPTEVVPEFIADLGLKKGEKVDYAIFENNDPILIIECKHWLEDLNVHNSQLFRYFHVTKTRFALLTNGIEYKFYSDLDSSNKMDEKPFLEFDLNDLKESTAIEIAKFHKSNFDVDKIINTAGSLKKIKEIKKIISNDLKEPSPDFVKYFASQVYSGRLTEKVMEQFSELVHKAWSQLISERVNDRLTSALNKETEKQKEVSEAEEQEQETPKIITTEEEMEGYQIIRAIARRMIPVERIAHRDTQSYFGVLLDDNNRKPIVRLHLNGGKKYISLFDKERNETKEPIETVDDIYKFEARILESIECYM
jgi:hypothetical protein